MKRTLTAFSFAAALFAGAATAETPAADAAATTAAPLEIYGVRVGNPLDSSTWWSTHGHEMTDVELMDINPMDPTFWIAAIDPQRHHQFHATMINPASMAQFMQVETYTNMMALDVWAKWVDLDSYAPLLDPQTYAYWMQPGAYVHMFDTAQLKPMMDIDNYTIVMHDAMETAGLAQWVHAGVELAGLTPRH